MNYIHETYDAIKHAYHWRHENITYPEIVENKGESDHVLENLEILEILQIPPVKRPLT